LFERSDPGKNAFLLSSLAKSCTQTIPAKNLCFVHTLLIDFQRLVLIKFRSSYTVQHQKGSSMALVLCAGADVSLVRTRQLILERSGHVVVPAMDEPTLIAACGQHKFEVAVLGHSLSPKAKRRIADVIREHCPATKVLELYALSTGTALEDADAWLEVPAEGPQDLVARVQELISK
jgi:CheY-like chemotaxis protein